MRSTRQRRLHRQRRPGPAISITSPSQCCSAACSVNCTVAANSGLFRREDQLQQPAAEVRSIHPLARIGEDQLFDHVADVIALIVVAVLPRPSKWYGKSIFTFLPPQVTIDSRPYSGYDRRSVGDLVGALADAGPGSR